MSLRTKVVYTARPHPGKPRCHTVPREAVRLVLNDHDALLGALHVRQCLVQISIVDHHRLVARYPTMLMHTTPEDDLVCTEELFPQYPEKLSNQAWIVVEMVVVD